MTKFMTNFFCYRVFARWISCEGCVRVHSLNESGNKGNVRMYVSTTSLNPGPVYALSDFQP